MKRFLSGAFVCFACIATIFVAGCGSGYHPNNNPGAISVMITSPASAPTIQQGQTVNITASVANDSYNRGVTWSLSGQGTLSAQTATTVTYTAPATVAANITATVTATSMTDTTKTATLTITVTPPPAISVTITNKFTTIAPGAAKTLNATVQNDSANKGVTWTLTAGGAACAPAACGTLSGNSATSVTYTAPATVPPAPNNAPTITATSVSDGTKSDSDAFTITGAAPPIAVTITNKISTIAAGAAPVTFNASVANDPSNKGVSWALNANGATGTSCDPTCGSLSAQTTSSVKYTPPAAVPGSPNNAPTLVATSVADTTKSDSDGFTITSTSSNNNAELKGQYAFLVGGFDDATGNQFAYIGSLTADGAGNITSGVEDVNLPSTVKTSLAVTGTYTVGLDNRGTATITTTSGSNTFAFSVGSIIGGVATKVHIIEFDDSNGTSGRRGSGVAYLQTAAAFNLASINGPYAFQFVGQDFTAGTRLVNTGAFTANGSGSVTGTLDFNDSGTFSGGNSLTATISTGAATATNGRVTMAFMSPGTANSVEYIVSANRILLMTTDAESTKGLLSGQIVTQTSTAFTNTSLNGTVIFYATGRSSVAGDSSIIAGILTFNSTTLTITLSADQNDGGTAGTQTGTFSYSVSANGHVTITGGGGNNPDLYLVDTNKAFFMGTAGDVNAGFLEPQSAGPFTNSSVSGNYFSGEAEYAAVKGVSVRSGIETSTGNGTVNLTLDTSSPTNPFLISGQTLTITLTVAATGRATDNFGDIYYIISPTKLVLMDGSGSTSDVTILEQ
ncbi:MAG: beta strand repeat-containing protein [Candidatus Acidiferrales bacterium]